MADFLQPTRFLFFGVARCSLVVHRRRRVLRMTPGGNILTRQSVLLRVGLVPGTMFSRVPLRRGGAVAALLGRSCYSSRIRTVRAHNGTVSHRLIQCLIRLLSFRGDAESRVFSRSQPTTAVSSIAGRTQHHRSSSKHLSPLPLRDSSSCAAVSGSHAQWCLILNRTGAPKAHDRGDEEIVGSWKAFINMGCTTENQVPRPD